MFRSKKAQPASEGRELAEQCRIEAEALYSSGTHHCAEAVVGAVSGFGGGSGSGCICGAVSGDTAAMGLVVNSRKDIMHLTRELHTWFKEKYRVTCCKTIRAANDKGICPIITGEVAGRIAEMLSHR
ncbi:C-GCAxxG-C-C family protein [Geobacter sp. SVR]|uniref:C-GCAxxG-C-C family protein n=1 Tax=Geobacter sp. SVR TaxID=2495594 RepID=UPI00143F02F9|nr:C-GCAxxG-C-C family protein [Geobacter sp. SVR]BCS52555.1 hypothetical protein GSVR_08630 [Geobacter sp. SVR]GCF84007.1 hypothetical protein GSbR_06070 [Geobacter sp. SVR]